jgi:AcrR family transcriptional regulator
MARSKEFDRDAALEAAIVTFATRGFEGTSTDDLLQSMKIGRQSLYDTFGDKRQLYLAALRKYSEGSFAAIQAIFDKSASPAAGIEGVLLDFARNPRRLGSTSCLGVSSICEFGRSDPDVAKLNDEAGGLLEKAFERQVRAAIEAGEMDATLHPREVARFLTTTICGMKVAGAAGSSATQLTSVVRLALKSILRR